MTDENPNLLVGMLGVLKAGYGFVPILPDYPDERVDFIVRDCMIKTLLVEKKYLDKAHQIRERNQTLQHVICIDDIDGSIAAAPGRNGRNQEPARPDPDDLCYVIYTSGSTGKPKGVPITHRNLIPHLMWAREHFSFGEETRTIQNLSYSFDFGVSEVLTTILFGGTIYFLDKFRLTNLSEYVDFIVKNQINTINTTPSFFKGIASVGQRLPTIKTLHFGGEELTTRYMEEVFSLVDRDCEVHNGYGPTEASVNCAILRMTRDTVGAHGQTGKIPIGRATANNTLYVLDRNLQPVPVGVPGELHVGGDGLSWGYVNRPDLTAEKFIPDPFSDKPGARLYKTGDLVRYLPDGNIEFLGRIDYQVKVRGFRIEPGEIEAALSQHPSVRQSVVIVREDTPGEKQLVGYVVADPASQPPVSELRRFLKTKLPEYMVPSVFVFLDTLPLTASGKVDRRALPGPGEAPIDDGKGYTPPRNRLEEILVEMWQELLGVEGIGIHDNFFELGGDSLRAAVFANRLQKLLDEVIYVVVLFDTQTIAALSDYLSEHFPAAVARVCGTELVESGGNGKLVTTASARPRIDADKLEQIKRLVISAHPYEQPEEEFLNSISTRNPRAIFVLSAPRSGSTLLRVMLAGHPRLFSPPELALLSFRTLGERKAAFEGRDRGWLEGVHRALMEIKGCDFDEARAIMARYEDQDLTTHQFYRLLQEWIGDRTLVDKTTLYAMSVQTLQRAEAYFEDAVYIHLVRHPAAMIQSYIDSNLDQVFAYDLPFPLREKAELLWLLCNQNIRDFLDSIPGDRRYSLRFEDVLEDPRGTMEDLCSFLGLEFVQEMLEPYRGNKMIDGVHPESRMVGDPRFHEHRGIERQIAQKWRTLPPGDSLSSLTQRLSEPLGYEDVSSTSPAPEGLTSPQPVPRDQELPLSFAQQRLWFLDQMEPESPIYNIPAAVRLKGTLNVIALEKGLNELIRRHESLRTTFSTVAGRAVQEIHPAYNLKLPVVDLTHLPEAERENEAMRLAHEEVRRSFDLAKGPLLRLQLLRLGEEDHVLVVSMHHIISDGWSVGVLIRELTALYDAFLADRPSPLPDLPIQYADFAYWQRHWLEGEEMERQLAYWKEQLGDSPPVLELPTDRPRPATQTFRGARTSFELPVELFKKLRDLSQQEDATLFMTLMAAYMTLLYRYSRQEDLCVGTPVANRSRAETESIIGFFVNTLVIRGDLSGAPSFRELLRRIRKVSLEAFAHQDVPFEKIVDALQPERDLSHSPLFQVMLVHQKSSTQTLQVPGLTLQPLQLDTGTAKFDLTLTVVEEGERLRGEFEYNTDLFEATTIERMVTHFRLLLESVVEDPARSISTIPLLTQGERDQLLTKWGRAERDWPQQLCVHRWFEKQVQRSPDSVAVAFGEERLTYRELNGRANQLARHLRKLGVGPEVVVGLCIDRSLEMMVGLLGILKAGGAYLPLDPSYPSARLAFMLEDSGVSVLITREELQARLPDHRARVVCLDRDQAEIETESKRNLAGHADLDHLAYVIYTSGSTGKPKGVLITHRGLTNYLNWCLSAYPVDRGSGSLVHSPLAFDATITAIFPSLLVGGTVTLLPEGIDIEELGEALRQGGGFSLVKITPMHLDLLGQHLSSEEAAGLAAAFVIGGENLTAEQIAFWQEHAKDTLLFNEYGPTETVVGCVVYEVPSGWRGTRSVPIGEVIPNAWVYVLDEHMEPVPVGVPGELYIGGVGVARGYLGRPDLTAEKFVPDPFSDEPGARVYRTGDLVRYLPDGNLEFLGRLDEQVKIRGYRIEVGEIEAVLARHPDLKEVAVLAREDTPGDRRLVAYCVPQSQAQPTVSDLHQFLREELPDFMIPAAFVMLSDLPLTPNGKVDRRALPQPDGARPDLKTEFVAPRTPKEEALAKIWSDILKVDKVGVHDNFFELGGDSILSIQVIARAAEAGMRLTPKQIFQHPTVEGLAAVAVEAPAIKADQGILTGEAPLIPIQHWFFEQNLPEPHHWNQSILLQVSQPLQPSLLKDVVRHLLRHHDALRMRYQPAQDGWRQFYAEVDEDVPFAFFDLTSLSQKEQKLAIQRQAQRLQSSLDLSRGPLFRLAYFDLGRQQPGRLLIVIHHLVVDGLSWRILMEDLQTAYAHLDSGRKIEFAPKTTSFGYWAQRLSEYAQSEELRRELDHWLGLKEDAVVAIPTDFSGKPNTEASARTVSVSLSAAETRSLLQEVPAAYNTQINEVLLTALAKCFSRWTGRRKLTVDLEGHGREDLFEDVDLSRTVGWFTTMFPVSLDLGSAVSPGEALVSVKEQVRAVPNRGIGYGLLRYLCEDNDVRQRLAHLSAGDVSFNYLGQFDQGLPEASPFEPAPEAAGPERSPKGLRTHLLDITGSVRDGRLTMKWTYSKNLHRRETVEALADSFLEELRALITHCQSPDAGGYTPSDFRDVDLSQEELEGLISELDEYLEDE
jgi:amino acid adenylation domain-containing protein/non-ribosomal peptide synthase protein (TIGR01720 family)